MKSFTAASYALRLQAQMPPNQEQECLTAAWMRENFPKPWPSEVLQHDVIWLLFVGTACLLLVVQSLLAWRFIRISLRKVFFIVGASFLMGVVIEIPLVNLFYVHNLSVHTSPAAYWMNTVLAIVVGNVLATALTAMWFRLRCGLSWAHDLMRWATTSCIMSVLLVLTRFMFWYSGSFSPDIYSGSFFSE